MTDTKTPPGGHCCRTDPVGSPWNILGDRKIIARRDFFRNTLGMAGIYPLCCTSPEIPRESIHYDGEKLILDLPAIRELKKVGSSAVIYNQQRKINLIVAHAGRRHFAVLDRTCTHGGAMCAYNHSRRTLQCTSLNHAEYGLDGTLLHERTHGNLQSYQVRFAGKGLEIFLRAQV